MNWQRAIKEHKDYLKIERGVATNTIESYSRDVNKLANFIENNEIVISPEAIGTNSIQEFLYGIAKIQSATSQARILSGIRNFFDYLILEGYRQDNPTDLIEMPKTIRKIPDFLSEEEIDTIINTIDRSEPQGERNKAILETLYSCGLRVSELINLKMSDLYFEEGFIRVIGKGNKQRLIPIAEVTISYINIYRKHQRSLISPKKNKEDILFLSRNGNSLSRIMIFNIVKKQLAKTTINKKVSPHTFRHSFASHLLNNGADLRSIQRMLGHESITTTEIYLHTQTEELRKVIENYHPRNQINRMQ